MHRSGQGQDSGSLQDPRAARSSALLAATGFPDAVATYCRDMAAMDFLERPAAKMFHQFGRYMIGFLLVHQFQHWRRHGGPPATLGRLQASSPLSPRQTAAVVAALRAGHLLTAAPLAGSRAPVLSPAPALTATIARSMIACLRAADTVEGRLPRAPLLKGDPELQNELVYRSAVYVFARGSHLDAYPAVRHFTHRDCGYLVLVAVMAVALSGPKAGPSLSCRSLARHFNVSRSHVGNLLAAAAQNGWFVTDGHGRLSHMAPDFVREFQRWAATEMAHYATLADTLPVPGPRAAAEGQAA